jgi:DNA recombination protein RmuC
MTENTESILLILVLALPIMVGLLLYFYYNGKLSLLQEKINTANGNAEFLKTELAQERQLLNQANERYNSTERKYTAMEVEFQHLQSKYHELLEDEQKQIEKFENIANRVLKSQSHNFDTIQKEGMKQILVPLQEKIKVFEERIDKNTIETVKRHESLKEQIKYLNERSDQVSKEANNLAKALKGDYKKQGNWGELILESILDKSGLIKDREYFIQTTERNHEGKMIKPDVVIHLPDEKKLIIDSKVSLVAYEKMVNSEEEDNQKLHQKAHMLAVKNHIDGLSSKNYHDLYEMASPDFVMMFIPIDTAFSAALQTDPELYAYAFDKNIVIVTSSTLLATLKTVESMWRNEKQNKYALEIATEAGKMYDKFVGFVEDMDKLGNQLNTVTNTYHDNMKKLSTGSGNLIKRAEKVKDLGAKANKSLPKG